MNRGQFAIALVVVAVAGLLGGVLSGWAGGRPASAQVRIRPARPSKPELMLDPQTRKELARMTFPEIPPDKPLTIVKGTLHWAIYDRESRTFSVLLERHNAESILLRTNHGRMQSALQTAYAHDDTVTVEVKHQPSEVSLLEIYEALYVQTQ